MKLLYAGSFDPLTWGHLDIIKRAYNISKDLTILIANNPAKKYHFSLDHRVMCLRNNIARELEEDATNNITIGFLPNNQLLVEYAVAHDISHVVRGVRNVQDFTYEQSMHCINDDLSGNMDTIVLFAHHNYLHVSSSAVNSILQVGSQFANERVRSLIPPETCKMIETYYTVVHT